MVKIYHLTRVNYLNQENSGKEAYISSQKTNTPEQKVYIIFDIGEKLGSGS